MNISLTPELKKYIQAKVECGMYTSASEVVHESLRLMHTYDEMQQHRLSQLNKAVDIGMNQLKRGKRVSGKVSYEKMKRKISKIAKRK